MPPPYWRSCSRSNPDEACCHTWTRASSFSSRRAILRPGGIGPVAVGRTSTNAGCDNRARLARASCAASKCPMLPTLIDSRPPPQATSRSEEHTSELQSRLHLVCRLLLEKKKKKKKTL